MRKVILLALAAGCSGAEPPEMPVGTEAISFLGDSLRTPPLSDSLRAAHEQRLAQAESVLAANPGDADALIWVGRRTAYLGRYRDAIAIFTRGIAAHPEDARFLRHRGHRWITVRQLDSAIADLQRAADMTAGRPDEVEPDGLPNARGIPTSTLQSNIWYHLALAHYLTGSRDRAIESWRRAAERSTTLDNRVAASYWLYLSLRRQGGHDAEVRALLATITPDLDIIENTAYWRLLLAYGTRTAMDLLPVDSAQGPLQDAATAYGVGAWALLEGDSAAARQVFQRIRASGNWAAFGFIAAEAELARLQN